MTKNELSHLVLSQIRERHDTTVLSGDEFANLAQTIAFYLRSGRSVEATAILAAEECIPNPPRIGRDLETGKLYELKR